MVKAGGRDTDASNGVNAQALDDRCDAVRVAVRRNDVRGKDLGEIGRAGKRARRMLRREAWCLARKNWKLLSTALLIHLAFVVALGTLPLWTAASPLFAAFVAGLVLGTAPTFGYVFMIGQGLAHRQMGPEAERWTAEELAKLDARKWRVIHDVMLEGENVDHVAVGPGRVYAIETKWTTSDRRFLSGAARQAERRAENLAGELAARGVERKVIPLLVVWGPGIRDTWEPKATLERKTRVVAGVFAETWLVKMTEAADHIGLDFAAFKAVEALAQAGDEASVW